MKAADTAYAALQRLRYNDSTPPANTRDAAIALLETSTTRRQHIDTALEALRQPAVRSTLTDAQRPPLRRLAQRYFSGAPSRDKGGMIREAVLKLLVHIGHPDDLDLYARGVWVVQLQPVTDTAQNLRGVSLAGLAAADPDSARWHATRLLGDPDTSVFNGEPAVTAVAVLAEMREWLPLYYFALNNGPALDSEGYGEAPARALEHLAPVLPAELYIDLAVRYIEAAARMSCTGIIDGAADALKADADSPLIVLFERLLGDVQDEDLHRYAAIVAAGARVPPLTELLLSAAKLSPRAHLFNYIDALALVDHPARDDTLAALEKRIRPSP